MMSQDHVLLDMKDGVATLTLNRPDVLNALSPEMTELLLRYSRQAADDPNVRCVVLRGAGRAFMAGGDVKKMHERLESGAQQSPYEFELRVVTAHQIISGFRRMEKPVVAAVHGPVAGIGFGFMLSADLAIARADTTMTLAYRHIGLTSDGGASYFLPRIVGERKAMELALFGDKISATEAKDLGIVNRVAEDAHFEAAITEMARRLAEGPRSIGRIKRLIRGSLDTTWQEQSHREAESIAWAAGTSDHREGVAAFAEKRKVRFTGE